MKDRKKQGLAPLEYCVARPLTLGLTAVCAALTALAVAAAYPLAEENGATGWLAAGAALAFGLGETAIILLLRFVIRKYLRPVSVIAEAAAQDGLSQAASRVSPTSAETEALLRALERMDQDSAARLSALEEALRRMASGDLTPPERGRAGECGGVYDALEDASQTLKGALGSLRTSLEQLTGPLDHLEQDVSDLTQYDRERQALDELLRAMDQLAERLRRRAGGAADVSGAADALRRQLVRYDQRQRELEQAIRRVNDCAGEAGKIVKDMETASFQCSVLARTAYVEAAGAGVNGKGFAVVASELRVLASRSAQAAQDAAAFLDAMRGTVRESVALSAAVARELESVSASGTEVCRKAAGAAQDAALTNEWQEALRQANRLDALSEDEQARAARVARTAQVIRRRFQKAREVLRGFRLHQE